MLSRTPTRILGLSGYYHDSAAALVVDGKIVAAAQEERFTRKKHDARFPENALAYCLDHAGIELGDVDYVAFYDKPFLKFERLLETYLAYAPRGFSSFKMALPVWIREKLFQKDLLVKELRRIAPKVKWADRLLFTEHHESHAASAFFPSPFDEAVVLTMNDLGGHRSRQPARRGQGTAFSAFAGPALFCLHLLYRLHGQFRRVQGDGPGALWRAEICRPHPQASHRSERGRHVPHRSVILRLLHRPDDDERQIRRLVRRAAPRSGDRQAHSAPHGSRRVDSGRDGGDRAASHPLAGA